MKRPLSSMARVVSLVTIAALALTAVVSSSSPAAAQVTGTAPILIITDAGSGNPFGSYLQEILTAEGVNDVEVRPLADLNSALLAGRSVVILGEASPTSAQISALDTFVSAGGGLIAMRPSAGLSTILGVTLQGGTTNDGYMRITDSTLGAGLYSDTMQFHGSARQFALNGAEEVARLYSTRTSATSFPAVTIADHGSGKAVMFAYDLARSVVLTRQGNPANANVDVDGDGILRTIDLFRNWTDLERSHVPQADMQQRLFVRLLEAVNAQPVPRLWFFPNNAPTVVVVTGDAHGPNPYWEPLIDAMQQQNSPMTVFGLGATDEQFEEWMAEGYDFASHPYVDCGYECGVAEGANTYENLFGFIPRTERTHQIRWSGWTDAASILAQYGVEMDFNFYQWGSWVATADGSPALGYITGSAQPMRFVDANGNILPIYQQQTNLVDEFLAPRVGIAGLDLEQGLAASRETIDAIVGGYHVPIVTQYHEDYFWGETATWDVETNAYALQQGAVPLHAEAWLDFVEQRAATSVSNSTWTSNTLAFDVASGGPNQRMLIPLHSGGGLLNTVQVGGSNVSFSTKDFNGTAYAVVPVSTAHYVATYTPDTTAPTVTGTVPASGATDVSMTTPVSVTFSEVMQRPLTEAAFSISPATQGTISWNSAGTVMTFTPSSLLSPTTTYTAAVSTGAQDLAGNSLSSAANWSFTTEEITPPPTITGVSPVSGTIEGGTVVTITGTDFTGATSVLFGATPAALFSVDSDTSISATSPGHAAGSVSISVTTPAGSSSASPASQYTYFDPASTVSLLAVDPGIGATGGGAQVTLTGSGFAPGASVTFGGVPATNVTFVSSTRITATAPAHAAGPVTVVVTNVNTQSGTLANGFTYVDCAAFCLSQTTTADFRLGTMANSVVTQTTDGEVTLAPAASAEFSGTALPAGWTASPWAAGGGATLSGGAITVDGALVATSDFFGAGRSVEFVATFQANAPNQHVGLGVNLTDFPWAIFSTGADGVTLLARTSSSFTTSQATTLPSSYLGGPHRFRIDWQPTSVTYYIDGLQVATHPLGITQNMRPVISDGPVGGATLGIDWMRLTPYAASGTYTSRVLDSGGAATWQTAHWTGDVPTGTSLSVSVRTGNTPAPDGSWSAFTPLSGSGAAIGASSRYLQYQVSLTTSDQNATAALRNLTLVFSVTGPVSPTITTVTPEAGTTDGGTTVTITGTSFAAGASVTLGGVAATNVTVVNPTTITATTAAHAPGVVDVVVTNTDGLSGTLAGGYTYVAPPPTVTEVDPATGSVDGGTQVTISGTNLLGATDVRFGTASATFTVVSTTEITATAPAHAEGAVDITVTTPSGTSPTSSASQYSYQPLPPAPVVTLVDSGTGSIDGNATVTIIGEHFGADATVTFGGTAAQTTFVSSTQLTAVTPPHAAGSVTVSVTSDGQTGSLQNGYTYVDCTTGCVTDTTAADFGAGTTTNTSTGQAFDGEVTLALAAGSEFGGATLPADWTSTPWVSGGSATVAGGNVSVDGTLLATSALFGSGRVLEFRATFLAGVASQHAGLGTNLNNVPWAIFSTGSNGSALLARTSFSSTTLGAAYLGSPHTFRIEWQAAQVVYAIDGVVVATHSATITQTMRPVASDGSLANGPLVLDWMRLTPYAASGTYTSRVLDAGGAATWDIATWASTVPAGTTLTVSVRTGDTPVPDGTWSAFTPLASSGATVGATARYVQYQLSLGTTNVEVTPVLRDIVFTFTPGGQALAAPPEITLVNPNSGPVAGGTDVTITGTGFSGATGVSFGGAPAASFQVESDTELTATSPAGSPGGVDVAVTSAAGTSPTNPSALFTYVAGPSVTAMSPSSGPTDGGTAVTINGSDFQSGATVTVGGVAAANIVVTSATQITAVTPPHPEGVVDIVVANPDTQSSTLASAFAYAVPEPTPVTAAPAAPTAVTIQNGFGLSGGVGQLALNDQRYRVIQSTLVGQKVVAFYAQYTVPAAQRNLVGLTLAYDGGASRTGLTRTLSVFHWSQGTWESIGEQAQTVEDLLTTITVTGDPMRFMNANGVIRFRVRTQAPASATIYRLNADFVSFTTTYLA